MYCCDNPCCKWNSGCSVLGKNNLELSLMGFLLMVHSILLWCLTDCLILFPQDAVSLVKMEEEPEAAARKLTETAFSRGSGDNITCIVVKFQHDKPGSSGGGDSPFSPPGEKSWFHLLLVIRVVGVLLPWAGFCWPHPWWPPRLVLEKGVDVRCLSIYAPNFGSPVSKVTGGSAAHLHVYRLFILYGTVVDL